MRILMPNLSPEEMLTSDGSGTAHTIANNCQHPLRILHARRAGYFVIAPQAMRSPALPAGSVFMSSAAA